MLAWAWKEFFDSGDHEWLPRLPMAKAVMKAMQAVQEYTTQENIAELDGWLVSGASKRGWTTWMVGAAAEKCTWCPKVDALAPIVPIVPNLREGVHHMWQAYGGFSFAFNDYTAVNLTTLIDSDEVIELFKIVDPINYLSRLDKIPKMVIDSSDDEFMMMEWTNNWFDAFNENGEMHLWIGANVEHSMATGVIGLMKTLGNYANSVFLGGTRPKFSHTLDKTNGQITVEIPADQAHGKVVLRHGHTLSHTHRDFRWIAGATQDKEGNATCAVPRVGPFHTLGSDVCFQPIIWTGTTLNETTPGSGKYVGQIPTPKIGWIGAFVEVFFPSDTGLKTEYQFTTPGMVWPQRLPFPPCHAEECVGNLI
jgi:PhoPQ-activated pathogenicity-related protein